MSDLVAMRDCPNESTGKDDSIHSSICFDSSNVVSSLRSQIADQERHTEWIPWTNEKHSLYLDSLEMSFVKELQHSVYSCDLLGRETNYWPGLNSHNCPRQTKIPIMASSGVLGECREERCETGNLTTCYASARNSQRLPLAKHRFQDYVSSTEEVSDQNFEDVESDTHWRPFGILYAKQLMKSDN